MSKYHRDVSKLKQIDVYKIYDLYEVRSHRVADAIEKLLMLGEIGSKDYQQDLVEAMESLESELIEISAYQPRVDYGVAEKIQAMFEESRPST